MNLPNISLTDTGGHNPVVLMWRETGLGGESPPFWPTDNKLTYTEDQTQDSADKPLNLVENC